MRAKCSFLRHSCDTFSLLVQLLAAFKLHASVFIYGVIIAVGPHKLMTSLSLSQQPSSSSSSSASITSLAYQSLSRLVESSRRRVGVRPNDVNTFRPSVRPTRQIISRNAANSLRRSCRPIIISTEGRMTQCFDPSVRPSVPTRAIIQPLY